MDEYGVLAEIKGQAVCGVNVRPPSGACRYSHSWELTGSTAPSKTVTASSFLPRAERAQRWLYKVISFGAIHVAQSLIIALYYECVHKVKWTVDPS